MITTLIHNSEFIIMITTLIQNSEFRIHNYDYHCWKNQGLKHKSKSSMFNVQSSKDKNP